MEQQYQYPEQYDAKDAFRMFVPLEIDTSDLQKADGELPASVLCKGLMSTEHRDLQKERIRQGGLDLDSYFMPFGRVTWGHTYAPEKVIGAPRAINKAQTRDGVPATELVWNLWLNRPLGRQCYDLHKAACDAGDRGIGLSIEGKKLQVNPEDPTDIIKAVVYHVAADPSPINPVCQNLPFDAIGKAMGMIAKGASLEANQVAELGPDADGIVAMLKAFMGTLAPAPSTDPRLRLVKARSRRELKALGVLVRHPKLTYEAALSFVDDPAAFVANLHKD